METETEGEEIERANMVLREEMLRYNVITDAVDPFDMMLVMVQSKMLLPVIADPEDPEGLPLYATLYKHEKGVELYVYTTAQLIPPSVEADSVC